MVDSLSGQQPEEDLYDLYSKFCEESRVAFLTVFRRNDVKQLLANSLQPIPRKTFEGRVADMEENFRQRFIHMMRIGHAATLQQYGSTLSAALGWNSLG